jgi:hypothetical protein
VFCQKCGTRNDDALNYCGECGERLRVDCSASDRLPERHGQLSQEWRVLEGVWVGWETYFGVIPFRGGLYFDLKVIAHPERGILVTGTSWVGDASNWPPYGPVTSGHQIEGQYQPRQRKVSLVQQRRLSMLTIAHKYEGTLAPDGRSIIGSMTVANMLLGITGRGKVELYSVRPGERSEPVEKIRQLVAKVTGRDPGW